jgi:hypothetical protein
MVVTDKLLVGLLTSHTDFSVPILPDLLGKSEGGGEGGSERRIESRELACTGFCPLVVYR